MNKLTQITKLSSQFISGLLIKRINNKNSVKTCAQAKCLYSNHSKEKYNQNINETDKYLSDRKEMTRFIRKQLPIYADAKIDWDSLKSQLKFNYNLPTNNFAKVLLPIASHSRAHVNTLISLVNYVKPGLINENDPVINVYYFLALCKIIEEGRDEMNVFKREGELVLDKILSVKPYTLTEGDVTKILVIIRDSILSLADSSIENCQFALRLWGQMLRSFSKAWKFHYPKPSIESAKLFELAFKKTLRNEAIEMMVETNKLVGGKLFNTNVNTWIETLLRLNNEEETKKFFETIKQTENVLDAKLISETVILLERINFKCQIEKHDVACSICKRKLGYLDPLNDEQFLQLQQIISDYWNGNLQSKPGPYEEFECFLDNCLFDFDLVIDSLNLIRHIQDFEKLQPGLLMNKLFDTITEKFNKILIIGKHKSFPMFQSVVQQHHEKLCSYLNIPQELDDDIFLLYAAKRNSKTLISSNDLFRNYYLKLPKKDADVFIKWRKTHQIQFDSEYRNFKFPSLRYLVTDINDQSIHVPFVNNDRFSWCCAHKKL